MNEATAQTSWTLKDGTKVECMLPSEAHAKRLPRWYAVQGQGFEASLPDGRDDLHMLEPYPGDKMYWAVVEALPPPKTAAKTKASAKKPILTTDKSARKEMPMARGLVDYFPRALAAVANVSFVANEQHNPGQPMHWAKEKSTDHPDCIMRHLVERGSIDDDGLRHSAKLAWRALALLETELETELEAAGAP